MNPVSTITRPAPVADRRWYSVPTTRTRATEFVAVAGQQIDEEQRQRICAWLTENGIDPALVPMGAGISVETRSDTLRPELTLRLIQHWEFLTNAQGQKLIDPSTTMAAQVERTVLLVADLPPQTVGSPS